MTWPEQVHWWDTPAQVAVAVITVLAALAATRARRRLRAVFLVGVTGYGVAILFLFHGAPDLALTQALVETVTLVVFVLVLRRLSGKFFVMWTQRVVTGMPVAGVGLVACA